MCEEWVQKFTGLFSLFIYAIHDIIEQTKP